MLRLYSKIKGDDGQIYSCNWDSAERVARIVAHELGHYLGLNESHCAGSIMGGWNIQWNSVERKATFIAAGHAIRDYECDKADEISVSPSEAEHQEQLCAADPNCDPYAPCWATPGCTCPILLDLDRDNFRLAGADDPVWFDIDADGDKELLTWTRRGSRDGFLCWDRNDNGRIDDGKELFGNSTPLVDDSIAPFGYLALSELDSRAFGGDMDGFITPQDAIYPELCVWIDTDHDGESDPLEIHDLAEIGITHLGVDWVTQPRRDRFGNLFLYHGVAAVEDEGGSYEIRTVDAYFVDLDVR
ncbi:MAG: hypothetical protein AAGF23_08330 [Acidobacteriota bacterium]